MMGELKTSTTISTKNGIATIDGWKQINIKTDQGITTLRQVVTEFDERMNFAVVLGELPSGLITAIQVLAEKEGHNAPHTAPDLAIQAMAEGEYEIRL